MDQAQMPLSINSVDCPQLKLERAHAKNCSWFNTLIGKVGPSFPGILAKGALLVASCVVIPNAVWANPDSKSFFPKNFAFDDSFKIPGAGGGGGEPGEGGPGIPASSLPCKGLLNEGAAADCALVYVGAEIGLTAKTEEEALSETNRDALQIASAGTAALQNKVGPTEESQYLIEENGPNPDPLMKKTTGGGSSGGAGGDNPIVDPGAPSDQPNEAIPDLGNDQAQPPFEFDDGFNPGSGVTPPDNYGDGGGWSGGDEGAYQPPTEQPPIGDDSGFAQDPGGQTGGPQQPHVPGAGGGGGGEFGYQPNEQFNPSNPGVPGELVTVQPPVNQPDYGQGSPETTIVTGAGGGGIFIGGGQPSDQDDEEEEDDEKEEKEKEEARLRAERAAKDEELAEAVEALSAKANPKEETEEGLKAVENPGEADGAPDQKSTFMQAVLEAVGL